MLSTRQIQVGYKRKWFFLFLVSVCIRIFFGKQVSNVLFQYDCDADDDEMDMCGNGNGREMRDGSV